jgi:hypothetical protein
MGDISKWRSAFNPNSVPTTQTAQTAANDDRKTIDTATANQDKAAEGVTGTINVNVTAPAKTRVSARSGGFFKKTNVDRQTPISEPASAPSEATGGL